MSKLIFDFDEGEFALKMSDDLAIDMDGGLMMKMADNMAMDMDTGDLHITSFWHSEEDDEQ